MQAEKSPKRCQMQDRQQSDAKYEVIPLGRPQKMTNFVTNVDVTNIWPLRRKEIV